MDEEILDAIEGEVPEPQPYECVVEVFWWWDDTMIARVASTFEGTVIDLKFLIAPLGVIDLAFVDSLLGDDDDDADDADDLPIRPLSPSDFIWIGGGGMGAEIDETEEEEVTEWEMIELGSCDYGSDATAINTPNCKPGHQDVV